MQVAKIQQQKKEEQKNVITSNGIKISGIGEKKRVQLERKVLKSLFSFFFYIIAIS